MKFQFSAICTGIINLYSFCQMDDLFDHTLNLLLVEDDEVYSYLSIGYDDKRVKTSVDVQRIPENWDFSWKIKDCSNRHSTGHSIL